MGQYHRIVNLDKREYLDPYKLGSGAKAWEQFHNYPSKALIILISSSNGRGGGDLEGPEKVLGRWAGDRIAMIGDYSEREDLSLEHNADLIYGLCAEAKQIEERISWLNKCAAEADAEHKGEYEERAARLSMWKVRPYKDITVLVRGAVAKNAGCKWDAKEKAFVPVEEWAK